jgi:hypothetical protein
LIPINSNYENKLVLIIALRLLVAAFSIKYKNNFHKNVVSVLLSWPLKPTEGIKGLLTLHTRRGLMKKAQGSLKSTN